MKKIGTFYKGSWLWNFYTATYKGKEPNKNFCDYFWGLVLAFVSLPITWLSYCITYGIQTKWDYKERMFLSLILELLLFLIGFGFYTNWLKVLATTLGIATGVSIFIGICWALHTWSTSSTKANLSANISEIKTVAYEGFHSWKDRYCPQIEWVENPNKPIKTEE